MSEEKTMTLRVFRLSGAKVQFFFFFSFFKKQKTKKKKQTQRVTLWSTLLFLFCDEPNRASFCVDFKHNSALAFWSKSEKLVLGRNKVSSSHTFTETWTSFELSSFFIIIIVIIEIIVIIIMIFYVFLLCVMMYTLQHAIILHDVFCSEEKNNNNNIARKGITNKKNEDTIVQSQIEILLNWVEMVAYIDECTGSNACVLHDK